MTEPGATQTAELAGLQVRLRRLEGQVHGLAEMVERGRDTLEGLQQFSAMPAAGREAASSYACACAMNRAHQSPMSVALDDVVARLEPLPGRASRLPEAK